MKRIIVLAMAAMMSVAVLAGCGGGSESKNDADSSAASAASSSSSSSSSSSASSVDLNTVLNKINAENGLSLDNIDDVKKLKRYYNIEEADVKQFAGETDKSDPNAPIEIVLVEGTDADAAGRIESALNTRYSSVLNTYTSYSPDKVDMVKACKVTKDGNFVSMIITENAEAMVKTFQDSIK